MKISNISNHPSVNWTDEQKNAVAKFATENFWGVEAEIIDIPHPPIPPFATEDEVAQMALAAASAAAKNSRLVFLAGELSFCAAFLHAAEKFRLHVITSTTERIVEEKDGKKISVFKFAGIRRIYKPADLPEDEFDAFSRSPEGLQLRIERLLETLKERNSEISSLISEKKEYLNLLMRRFGYKIWCGQYLIRCSCGWEITGSCDSLPVISFENGWSYRGTQSIWGIIYRLALYHKCKTSEFDCHCEDKPDFWGEILPEEKENLERFIKERA